MISSMNMNKITPSINFKMTVYRSEGLFDVDFWSMRSLTSSSSSHPSTTHVWWSIEDTFLFFFWRASRQQMDFMLELSDYHHSLNCSIQHIAPIGTSERQRKRESERERHEAKRIGLSRRRCLSRWLRQMRGTDVEKESSWMIIASLFGLPDDASNETPKCTSVGTFPVGFVCLPCAGEGSDVSRCDEIIMRLIRSSPEEYLWIHRGGSKHPHICTHIYRCRHAETKKKWLCLSEESVE